MLLTIFIDLYILKEKYPRNIGDNYVNSMHY